MLLALALAAAAAALVATAGAETKSPRHQAQLDATVAYLQANQNMDGGFGGETGAPSDPDFSAWVALALAAADVNPRSQAQLGGASVYTYLAEHAAELTLTTDFERALLVVDATEYPPTPLGGVNLVEAILGRQLPDGGFPHEAGVTDAGMNDTIFAILALSPIKEPQVEAAVQRAAGFVLAEQNADHSWPSFCPKRAPGCAPSGKDPEDNVDMTGTAIEALNAAGLPGTEAQAGALEYLHEAQLPDGGFPEVLGETESNVGSTCWAVQGIWAAGGNPETWTTGAGGTSEEPLDYITSLQQPEGKIRYKASKESLGLWMTSYCSPALAGRALPIVPPPGVLPTPTASETETGAGSAAGRGDEGVTAGGGGNGAPDFSRPKAKSKGKTPGGARFVHGQGLRARDHSTTRRGANHHQATGTETAEPKRPAEADQEVGAVSAGTRPNPVPEPVESRREETPRSPESHLGTISPPTKAPDKIAPAPDEKVSGTVIGSPTGRDGKIAFGAPGLRSAGGGGSGDGTAIAIGAAALLAALLGVGWERRRGALA